MQPWVQKIETEEFFFAHSVYHCVVIALVAAQLLVDVDRKPKANSEVPQKILSEDG